MNKDVIYIEPEDDITDIITKIEKSKEKIVALVPPKKAGVFRSIVNIKLIAKAGATSEKSVVLVTVDPSIVKLAAATKLPVAKNLQSAPVIPETEGDAEDEADTHTIEDMPDTDEEDEPEADEADEDADGGSDSGSKRKSTKGKDTADDEADEEDDLGDEEEEKPAKKSKKSKKPSAKGILGWFKLHKKLSIFSGVLALALIAFLVWAFGFAPAVDITVAIKTDPKNFSESITFTDNLSDENAKEGIFYLEQKKLDATQEVNFDATGQKNVGEKASGDLSVAVYFPYNNYGLVVISQGDKFSISGLTYTADNAVSLEYSGNGKEGCQNKDNDSELVNKGCKILKHVPVSAVEPGAKYNIAASTVGWSTSTPVDIVSSEKAMAGGTDDIKTVVQQSDVETAKSQLTTSKEEENKAKLYETIDDKYYIIDASFEQSTSAATATPGVDEEVQAGVQPTLKATTTSSVYVIDKVKLEEYIKEKAELEDDQKIYEIKDIYIENINQIKAGSTNKLKAKYFVGPKITESEVVDKVKGKGLGDAQREIRDIYGVSDVKMEPSYPWVMTIPGDSNRVTVKFEVKDQDGNEIKAQDEESDSEDSGESDENQGDNKKSDKEE